MCGERGWCPGVACLSVFVLKIYYSMISESYIVTSLQTHTMPLRHMPLWKHQHHMPLPRHRGSVGKSTCLWCERSPDRNLQRAKNIMLRLTGYACCALGQGTFASLHPGRLNGYRPRLVNRLVVQWTTDPPTALYNDLAYCYKKEMGTSALMH